MSHNAAALRAARADLHAALRSTRAAITDVTLRRSIDTIVSRGSAHTFDDVSCCVADLFSALSTYAHSEAWETATSSLPPSLFTRLAQYVVTDSAAHHLLAALRHVLSRPRRDFLGEKVVVPLVTVDKEIRDKVFIPLAHQITTSGTAEVFFDALGAVLTAQKDAPALFATAAMRDQVFVPLAALCAGDAVPKLAIAFEILATAKKSPTTNTFTTHVARDAVSASLAAAIAPELLNGTVEFNESMVGVSPSTDESVAWIAHAILTILEKRPGEVFIHPNVRDVFFAFAQHARSGDAIFWYFTALAHALALFSNQEQTQRAVLFESLHDVRDKVFLPLAACALSDDDTVQNLMCALRHMLAGRVDRDVFATEEVRDKLFIALAPHVTSSISVCHFVTSLAAIAAAPGHVFATAEVRDVLHSLAPHVEDPHTVAAFCHAIIRIIQSAQGEPQQAERTLFQTVETHDMFLQIAQLATTDSAVYYLAIALGAIAAPGHVFATAEVRDVLHSLAPHVEEAHTVAAFCHAIVCIIENTEGEPQQAEGMLFQTADTRDMFLKIAQLATTNEAMEWCLHAMNGVCAWVGGSENVFATETVRDMIFIAFAKRLRTLTAALPAVQFLFRLLIEMGRDSRTRDVFATCAVRDDVFIALAPLVATDDEAVRHCMHALSALSAPLLQIVEVAEGEGEVEVEVEFEFEGEGEIEVEFEIEGVDPLSNSHGGSNGAVAFGLPEGNTTVGTQASLVGSLESSVGAAVFAVPAVRDSIFIPMAGAVESGGTADALFTALHGLCAGNSGATERSLVFATFSVASRVFHQLHSIEGQDEGLRSMAMDLVMSAVAPPHRALLRDPTVSSMLQHVALQMTEVGGEERERLRRTRPLCMPSTDMRTV